MVVRRLLRCGLPVFLAFCAIGSLSAGDRGTGGPFAAAALQSVLASNARASWTTAVPLRSALTSLAEQQKFAFFLDRRIDPSTRVQGEYDAPVLAILQALGDEGGFSGTVLRGVVYLGPAETTRRLQTIDRLCVQKLRKLPAGPRRHMIAESPLQWETLSTPREIIYRLAKSMRARIVGLEQVPHDLWAERQLPALPKMTQLTMLLAGFDLTFDVKADGALQIRPITETDVWVQSYPISLQQQDVVDRLKQALPDTEIRLKNRELRVAGTVEAHAHIQDELAGSKPRSTHGTSGDTNRQFYSLQVVRKPVRLVLEQIASAAKLQLKYDRDAITRAGRSIDTSVTFEVKDATLEELLKKTTGAAGLKYELNGSVFQVTAGE